MYFCEITKILFKELIIIFLSYYNEILQGKVFFFIINLYILVIKLKIYRPSQSLILNKLDAYSAKYDEYLLQQELEFILSNKVKQSKFKYLILLFSSLLIYNIYPQFLKN
ncbi:unnamed protein product [Paramecium sonneborni]|uniref:Uncharacterized protein n=1 Tax=Paramecium sonneborni TaxID=65129 RepID=A0A8S1Q5I1_9CILI|nr:unnamed protein product [Paramecium sonneborni]